MASVSPTQTQIFKTLGDFIIAAIPGLLVIQGQQNYVGEPSEGDFAVMWATFRARLATNLDETSDTLFTGDISGATLTVTSVNYGDLSVGRTVFGTGVAANTAITALAGGTGGVGAYTVSPAQNVPSGPLAAGQMDVTQQTEVTIQIDFHGPSSADNAQIVATLIRDPWGVAQFEQSGLDIAPLYAVDPKQVPFINAQSQYETRWIVEAVVQANQAVSVPQQYADALEVGIISVDAEFPP